MNNHWVSEESHIEKHLNNHTAMVAEEEELESESYHYDHAVEIEHVAVLSSN